MAASALLFDLDGTLWDSRPWYAALLKHRCGVDPAQTLRELRSGTSIASLLRQHGMRGSFRQLGESEAASLRVYDDVPESLEEITDRGIATGVVTNLPRWIAGPMLEATGISGHMKTIVTYDRTRRHKPDPAPLRAGLADLDVDPGASIWYVGDTEQDCRAAQACSVSFAWASYGYGAGCPPGASVALTTFKDVLTL